MINLSEVKVTEIKINLNFPELNPSGNSIQTGNSIQNIGPLVQALTEILISANSTSKNNGNTNSSGENHAAK
jgi:hypothetical protein